jgi:hypothetical protein
MSCEDFLYFYQALPVTILTAVSIFGIFYIYSMQQRDNEKKNIKDYIINFKESLSDFSDITFDVSYLLIPPRRAIHVPEHQSTSDIREILNISNEELVELEQQLIGHYNEYERQKENQDRSYRSVLADFESLQQLIYDKFLYVAGHFFEEPYSEIELIEVEKWIKNFVPFAKEIEGIKTGIPFHNKMVRIFQENRSDYNSRLHEDEVAKLIKFYRNFFKKFDDILRESLVIDDMIFNYYENKFNAILDSHLSRVCLGIIPLNLLIFGLIIPLYMISPIRLYWLSCQNVFWTVIIFIVLNFIPLSIAYMLRHKPKSVIKMSVFGHGSSRQLPINATIFFRNISRTPVLPLVVNSEIYINNKKIFSKEDRLSLGPYTHRDLRIDFRGEIEGEQNDIQDVLKKDINMIIRYYYMPLSIMNKISISKIEQKTTYIWDIVSKMWKIEDK